MLLPPRGQIDCLFPLQANDPGNVVAGDRRPASINNAAISHVECVLRTRLGFERPGQLSRRKARTRAVSHVLTTVLDVLVGRRGELPKTVIGASLQYAVGGHIRKPSLHW